MGVKFEIEHSNFVAYLTTDGHADAPRCEERALHNFLLSLAEPQSLISSTKGTAEDWTQKISNAARAEAQRLDNVSRRLLSAEEVSDSLTPLRPYFTDYNLYVLLLPSGYAELDEATFRFFGEAAHSSGSIGLVLMPSAAPTLIAQFLTPFPPLRALAENPTSLPLAIFWTPQQTTCVLPLELAKRLYRQELLPALEAGVVNLDEILSRSVPRKDSIKKILHLSDFHFGSRDAANRRRWLKERLRQIVPTVDRVVVTGDLFDEPNEEFRALFDEFRSDLEDIADKELLVIPGNHDVRRKGNAWGWLGRNSEYIADLQWSPLVLDDDLQIAFVSFNSSSTGNFARGTVTESQRRDRGVLLDKALRRKPEVADYLKVALVHHHPYAYGSQPTALYEKLMSELFGGEEKFIAFEESEDFMRWCANREVSLILHGHKHVPHFAKVQFASQEDAREITVVGCGSSTGVDGKPMCYDVITMDAERKKWNVLFYHDPRGDGSGFSLQSVAIDVRPPIVLNAGSGAGNAPSLSRSSSSASPFDTKLVDVIVEAEMTDQNEGSLVSRFWQLSSSQRRRICLQLGLLHESEIHLPESDRYKRALMRVGDREKLEDLAREIAKAEAE